MVSQDGGSTTAGVQFEQIWHGACPHVCLCFRRSATPENGRTSNLAVPTEPDARAEDDSQVDENLRAATAKKAITPGEITRTQDNEQNDASSSSEIIVCLKLSQTRSENVSTDVHILMYDSETLGVRMPEEEDTRLKTTD